MGMTGEQAYVLAKKLIEAGGGGGGTVDAYTKTQTDNLLNQKVDKEVGKGLFSGSYNDLTDAPTIPSKTSELQNDSGYLTEHQDLTDYAKKTELEAVENTLISEISRAKEADETLKSRVDVITSLPEGSTTGDAELQDIRVKADGTTATSAGNAVREQVSELKEDIENLEEVICYSKNLLDITKVEVGFVSHANGNHTALESFRCTDYIPVTGGMKLVSSLNGEALNMTFIATYNASKGIISRGSENTNKSVYEILNDTKYVRISYERTSLENVQLELSTTGEITKYMPYGGNNIILLEEKVEKLDSEVNSKVDIYVTSDIMDFYNSMLYAYNKKNTDVYIHSGTYTYTNEMIETIRSYDKRGVPIGNGCRYFFESGAKIVCDYTGDNYVDIGAYFSPLDTWNTGGSFELHNLDLISKGTIYAVHDDGAYSDVAYTHLYDNCSIILDNTGKRYVGYNRAIGGGTGKKAEIICRNCYFNSVTHDTVDISWHGNAQGGETHFAITNCYFDKSFGIDDSVANKDTKRIIFSSNSVKTDIIDMNNTSEQAHWTVLSWGNTVRGN